MVFCKKKIYYTGKKNHMNLLMKAMIYYFAFLITYFIPIFMTIKWKEFFHFNSLHDIKSCSSEHT